MIVRFLSRRKKADLMMNKRKKVFIREDLTNLRPKLLKYAMEKCELTFIRDGSHLQKGW